MKHFVVYIFLFSLNPALFADWDYKYFTLNDLIKSSSLIAVAEIEKIIEQKNEGKITQEIRFSPIDVLKGTESKRFDYHASFIPKLCAAPESFYITSPPGTRYLLFLKKNGDSYVSICGPCGALEINDYVKERVLWYTDDSKPQRFSDEWKEAPLQDVIHRIKEKTEQDAAANP